jgi:hypothetical protein
MAPTSIFESSAHLLHGALHLNGYGHLLRMNAGEGGGGARLAGERRAAALRVRRLGAREAWPADLAGVLAAVRCGVLGTDGICGCCVDNSQCAASTRPASLAGARAAVAVGFEAHALALASTAATALAAEGPRRPNPTAVPRNAPPPQASSCSSCGTASASCCAPGR